MPSSSGAYSALACPSTTGATGLLGVDGAAGTLIWISRLMFVPTPSASSEIVFADESEADPENLVVLAARARAIRELYWFAFLLA